MPQEIMHVLFCSFTWRAWRDVTDWPLRWKGVSGHRLWNVPCSVCFLVTLKTCIESLAVQNYLCIDYYILIIYIYHRANSLCIIFRVRTSFYVELEVNNACYA